MSDRIISASAALAEALHEEMARDERIFILGEDLTAHAGIFGQFKGIPEKFPGRILDTPPSAPPERNRAPDRSGGWNRGRD